MEYYVTRLSSNSHTFLAYHHFIYQNYQKKEQLNQFKNKYGVREVKTEKEKGKESKPDRSKNLPYPTMVFIPNYMDHSKETDINYDSDTDSEYDDDIEDDYKLSFELDLDYSSEFDLYV